MNLLFSLLVGLGVGVIISIPMGPVAFYIIQRALNGEQTKAIYVSVGSVAIDIFFCLIISMGVMSLVSPFLTNSAVQLILSGLVILYGLKMLILDRKKMGQPAHLPKQSEDRFESHMILLGMTMAGANPSVFVSYTAIISFLTAQRLLADTVLDKVVFSFANGAGTFFFLMGLLFIVKRNRHTISPKVVKAAGIITALAVIGFGVYFTIIVLQRVV